MKLFTISDTHGDIEWLKTIPKDTDFILHAGDITDLGSDYEVEVVVMAMDKTGHNFLLCPGNHDIALENNDFVNYLNEKYTNVVIINKPKAVELETETHCLNIWVNPYVIEYGHWAFGKKEEDMYKYLPTEKDEVNAILCHCPPSHPAVSHYDWHDQGTVDIGNKALTEYLANNSSKWVFCGHNHVAMPTMSYIHDSLVYNVATKGMVINLE